MYAFFWRRFCFESFLALAFFFVSVTAIAQDSKNSMMVFEVRKNLALANDAPVIKDYYISAGSSEGLKREMILSIKRKIPVHDGVKNQSRGHLVVTVGKVRLIHVEEGLAVARNWSATSVEQRPITGFEAIMVGDFVDLASAEMVQPGEKRKSASVETKGSLKEPAKPVSLETKPMELLAPKVENSEKSLVPPKPTQALVSPRREEPSATSVPLNVN